MSRKNELIEKVKIRLDLVEEAGFLKDNSEYFIGRLEEIPSERYIKLTDLNHICNYAISSFESIFSPAEELDAMGKSKWKFYQRIVTRGFQNLESKNDKSHYYDFLHLKKSATSALDNRVMHAHEARMPLWEEQDEMLGSTDNTFRENKDLVFRYRQILDNPYWNNFVFKKVYDKMDQKKLEQLKERALKWFMNFSEEELDKKCTTAGDYRVAALAYSHFDKNPENFFRKALKKEKERKDYWNQEKILDEMKEAGIKTSFWDRLRVSYFI